LFNSKIDEIKAKEKTNAKKINPITFSITKKKVGDREEKHIRYEIEGEKEVIEAKSCVAPSADELFEELMPQQRPTMLGRQPTMRLGRGIPGGAMFGKSFRKKGHG
jgi:hypothetical protein